MRSFGNAIASTMCACEDYHAYGSALPPGTRSMCDVFSGATAKELHANVSVYRLSEESCGSIGVELEHLQLVSS